ncbi:hypothetical protein [Williamsia deligens]
MASVAQAAHAAVSSLSGELGASSGMGGSDDAGTAWASGYDDGARAALSAAASAVGAVGNIATRLHATGENHAHADASSTIGGGGDAGMPGAPTPPTMSAPSLPSAAGGSGGGPPGWSLVEGLVGYVWPNGHQDRLHAADAAWKAAAAQLQDAAGPTSAAASAVSAQQSPEVAAAAQACTDAGSHLRDLSSVFTELGSSCSEYAAHLDKAHHEIIHELEVLLAQTVAIEAVSAIAGFFTAGIGELAGQAVETARLTAAANRIREIIQALIAAARTAAAAVGRVAAEAGRVAAEAAKAAGSQASRAVAEAAEATGTQAANAARSTSAMTSKAVDAVRSTGAAAASKATDAAHTAGTLAANTARSTGDLASKAAGAAPGFAKSAARAAPMNFATGAGMEFGKESVESVASGQNKLDPTKIVAQGAINSVTSPVAKGLSERALPKPIAVPGAKAPDESLLTKTGRTALTVGANSALNNGQQALHSSISPDSAEQVEGTSLVGTVKDVPAAVQNAPKAYDQVRDAVEKAVEPRPTDGEGR